jgi:cystathionine gamma-synthase/cystathionine gamma-lyase/cystathionine beta-lyase
MRGFAGMLSFEVEGGLDAAQRVIDRLILAVDAPSLGGPETLVTRPAGTSHVGLEPQERLSLGISDGLIRVSVGLEDPDDLVADFEAALE